MINNKSISIFLLTHCIFCIKDKDDSAIKLCTITLQIHTDI